MRNKILLFLLIMVGATAISFGVVKSQVLGKTLNLSSVQTKFGNDKFNAKIFKTSKPEVRAKMVANLIKSKSFVGQPIQTVFDQLGKSDGYFWNDFIPAYILNIPNDKNTDVWQVVFLPDRNVKIKEVIVNKNCCD